MINLNRQHLEDQHYKNDLHDLRRIQKALFIYRDLFVTLDEAAKIWQSYSSNLSAGWLFLPDRDKSIPAMIESDNYFKGYEDSLK